MFSFLVIPAVAGLAFIDNPWPFMLAYFIYYVAAIHQALCLSSLFSKTKMASEIGTVLTIIPIFLVFLIFVDDIRSSQGYYWLLGLFPQCAIAFSYIASMNSQSNFYLSPPVQSFFTTSDAIILLLLDVVIYIILYFYLDEVVSNEYGVSKHPLFFIKALFSKKKSHANKNKSAGSGLQSNLMSNSVNSESGQSIDEEHGEPR